MTLSNVSDVAIDKALFARITLKKYVSYTNHSGNVWKVSTTDFIYGIEFDPTEVVTVTRKSALSEVDSDGDWYWNRDNGIVYFYYSDDIDQYNIVLKISIFVTTTFDVLAKSDFEDASFNDLTVYEGRLQDTSFSQSLDDILNGKFGIFTGSINIINNDSRYNYLAVDNISFKNAEINIWIVINQISNRKLIFKGVCESASFSSNTLSLSIIEWTKVLQSAATFGDDETWYKVNSTRWPAARDNNLYKVIPFFMAGSSRKSASKTKSSYYYIDSGTYENVYVKNYEFWDIDNKTDFPLMYCGNDAGDLVFPAGKKYIVCRCNNDEFPQNFHLFTNKNNTPILIDAIADTDISVIQSVYFGSTYGYRYAEYSINATSTNINRINLLYPGMLVYLKNNNTSTFYEMIVTSVDTINKKFGIRYFSGPTNSSLKSSGHTFRLHYKGPTIYTMIGNTPVYLDGANYYFRREATNANNEVIYAIVSTELGTNSYEYFDGSKINSYRLYSDDLSWSADDVPDLEYYCRFLNFKIVSDMSEYDIGQALNYTTRKVIGLITDSSTDMVTTGNSYYDFKTKLGAGEYIDIISPEIGSDEPESYLNVIERILASTMSFLCQNDDGKIIVRLFENSPYNSVELNLTEDDIKDNTTTSDITFDEICSSISSKPEYSLDSIVNSSSTRNRRISGDLKFMFKHLLKSSSNYSSKIKSRLEAYKFNPIKRYDFTIINKGYELTLGDRINLNFDNSGKWLGTNATKSLFVISIVKSLSGVKVTAIENIFP